MLLIVLLPATNAPTPPINGDNPGHPSPATDATPLASTVGIDANPAPPPSDKINTCTIGTANNNAGEAVTIIRPDRFQARPTAAESIRCSQAVAKQTATNT